MNAKLITEAEAEVAFDPGQGQRVTVREGKHPITFTLEINHLPQTKQGHTQVRKFRLPPRSISDDRNQGPLRFSQGFGRQ